MTYALSAWLFARLLSVVYVIAFVSLGLEARGLWGTRGVLPIDEYLGAVAGSLGTFRHLRLPTIFWAGAGDGWLVAAAGAVAGALALAGVATGWMLLACFALYASFVNAGQDFLSFQWDILLLEVGFLTLFAVPWRLAPTLALAPEPHGLVRGAFYLILFKLMFLSGVVKLLSGDPAWRDLSALGFHYWTQPLPNPLSPLAHALPAVVHRAATLVTFAVELVLPFALAWSPARVFAAAGFTLLSLLIAVTGNYAFFNWLTIALCAWAVPDHVWAPVLARLPVETMRPPAAPGWATALVLATLYVANLGWCVRYFVPSAVARAFTPLLSVLQTWHVSNSYGLFATMTKTRPEIVIEGSDDGDHWREYVFKFKPGPTTRRPPVIAPLQPRLDWQMWFAALGTFRQNGFVGSLMARLFEGSPEVLSFFVDNPFPDEPPHFLRARVYEYGFRSPADTWSTGEWWDRRLIGEYTPTFRR